MYSRINQLSTESEIFFVPVSSLSLAVGVLGDAARASQMSRAEESCLPGGNRSNTCSRRARFTLA